MNERFFEQAWKTLIENHKDIRGGQTMSAWNKTIDKSGICPTITTRPEGFKTAILVIEDEQNNTDQS